MNRKEIIEQKLTVLNPHKINVIDNSTVHAGHSGNPDGSDGTHFAIEISSNELNGLSRVEQHRKINKLLEEEFNTGLHALTIKVV